MSASNQLASFNYAVQPLANLQIKNITAAYTVSPSDSNFILNCNPTASFTISMPPASSLPSGFNCVVWNSTVSTAFNITIDPNGAETIDGVATLILRSGEGMQIVCDGTNWLTGSKKVMRGYAENFQIVDVRPIAFGVRAFAIGYNTNASAQNSVAIGVNSTGQGSQTVTGSGAMALGGSYASGTNSFAAAIANNTSSYGAQGANSIAIGQTAQSNANYTIAIGYSAQSTNQQTIALGVFSNASSSGAVAIGSAINVGFGAYASSLDSFAFGDGAASNIIKKVVFAGWNSTTQGVVQTGILVLTRNTTDATATVLTSNASTPNTTNQIILPNNSAYSFTGTIVARQQAAGGTASAAWQVSGLIRREANAGTTTLVSSAINTISNVPAWTLALSADTTNGGLAITATGAAATNIRWVSTIQTSECTYA